MIKKYIPAIIPVIIFIISKDQGTMSAVRWLLGCLILAMAGRSLFSFRRLDFPEGGFSVYMCLGLAAVFTGVWFVCAALSLPFNSVSCPAGIILFLLIPYHYRKKKVPAEGPLEQNKAGERERFFVGFILFAIIFSLAFFVKGYKPFIDHQTEQYMDYAFMNAMYRQQKVPFEDMWFAGNIVNYYYLGQAAAVFMCRLTFVLPEYGYNLMLCTIFAALTMTAFGLISSFLMTFEGISKKTAVFGGTVSALLSSCGGNGHFIIYGIFKRVISDYPYWFPQSTLFIGYDPETLDKGKHEFPSYTLVLGDLHAHVCNMLFTLPLLAVLFDYALRDDSEEGSGRLVSGHIIFMGLLLGLFKGVNYWDFPIYYVVCGSVILFCDIKRLGLKATTVLNVLFKGLIIYLTGLIMMLPFELRYISPVTGIHICDTHSPLYKFIIIWFPYLIPAAVLIVYVLIKIGEEGTEGDKNTYQLLIILAVTLCALGLLLLPELIYVKDIYGEEYKRYNTMFKLTFQAFILMSLMTGTAVALLLGEGAKAKMEGRGGRSLKAMAGLLALMSFVLSGYMAWSVRAWFGNVFLVSKRQGISAASFISMDDSYADVRDAIEVINKDKNRKVHIIEEAGNSYQPENRLSVFTGACTVAGWYVHEWVWRNDPEVVGERHEEVRNFYSSGDPAFCKELAKKYDLDYIYVGPLVLNKYNVVYEGFEDLGERVWENDKGCMLIRVFKD